jgi:hypothetical protein
VPSRYCSPSRPHALLRSTLTAPAQRVAQRVVPLLYCAVYASLICSDSLRQVALLRNCLWYLGAVLKHSILPKNPPFSKMTAPAPRTLSKLETFKTPYKRRFGRGQSLLMAVLLDTEKVFQQNQHLTFQNFRSDRSRNGKSWQARQRSQLFSFQIKCHHPVGFSSSLRVLCALCGDLPPRFTTWGLSAEKPCESPLDRRI